MNFPPNTVDDNTVASPDEIAYPLVGNVRPARSEQLPQTVRLGSTLLDQHGALAGKTCHILGNGPSLITRDLSLLRNALTIGVNASPRVYPLIGHDPAFYCVSDRRFLENDAMRAVAHSAPGIKVFAGYCAGYLDAPNIHYVRIIGGCGISENIEAGIYHGYSVVFFAAQLALWLGCRNIILHGCEFDYTQGRFFSDSRPHDQWNTRYILHIANTLAFRLRRRGGALTVVGPSLLVGDFGRPAVPDVRRLTIAQWEKGDTTSENVELTQAQTTTISG